MGFKEKLSNEMSLKDINISQLAKQTGISNSTISSIFNKDASPSVDNASKIATALGVSLEYLATGKKSTPAELASVVSKDTLNIPFYGDVPVSAGGGSVAMNEGITEYLPFNKSWVKQKIGISEGLRAFPVTGDSMYPTYRSGDTVVCVDTDGEFKGDAIYIISLDGDIMIKRLAKSPQGILHIISDNPNNPNFEINLKEEHLNFKVLAIVKMAVVLS